jgi:hypothetical protein
MPWSPPFLALGIAIVFIDKFLIKPGSQPKAIAWQIENKARWLSYHARTKVEAMIMYPSWPPSSGSTQLKKIRNIWLS